MEIIISVISFVIISFFGWMLFKAKQDFHNLKSQKLVLEERLKNLTELVDEKENKLETQNNENKQLANLSASEATKYSELKIQFDEAKNNFNLEIASLKKEIENKTNEFNNANKELAKLSANNQSLQDRLETQKNEMENIRKQFSIEFENIAAKILDDKTKKFTELNKLNLETILTPFGKDIDAFKIKVEEVYQKESKERFSLGKEVEKLVQANQRISEETNNLTNALTSNSKTQGDWGQMILESILEKSGLVKDREYFVQEYLKDEAGNYHVNEQGNKMQPDVIIVYPDNRKVIVDSKVSLTAYNKYNSSIAKDEETKSLNDHLRSIRKHIDDLSSKNYQDFAPSLDFVMMFVPVEPAYLAALNLDQDLWNYAYKKRILLTSPSNLIVALRMIVDLWKKDSQSKNYKEIVERGGKLYDKFANVIDGLQDLGKNLKSAQKNYDITIGRISDGNDSVLKQVEKLKTLGVSTKKFLPEILQTINFDSDNEDLESN